MVTFEQNHTYAQIQFMDNWLQPKTTHIHEFINYRCSYLSDLSRSVCLCMCAPTCALEAFIVYHSVQCCGDLWASYQSFWVNREAPQIQFLRDKQVQVSVFPPLTVYTIVIVCMCAYICAFPCFHPQGHFLFPFSLLLFAFIPLLNRLAHSLYYTCFPTEVKNCIAGLAEREGDREADSEKMKNKEEDGEREE